MWRWIVQAAADIARCRRPGGGTRQSAAAVIANSVNTSHRILALYSHVCVCVSTVREKDKYKDIDTQTQTKCFRDLKYYIGCLLVMTQTKTKNQFYALLEVNIFQGLNIFQG